MSLDKHNTRTAARELLREIVEWQRRREVPDGQPAGDAVDVIPADAGASLDHDNALAAVVDTLARRHAHREQLRLQVAIAYAISDTTEKCVEFCRNWCSEPAAEAREKMLEEFTSKVVGAASLGFDRRDPSMAAAAARDLLRKLAANAGRPGRPHDDTRVVRRHVIKALKEVYGQMPFGSWSSVESVLRVLDGGEAQAKAAIQTKEQAKFVLDTGSLSSADAVAVALDASDAAPELKQRVIETIDRWMTETTQRPKSE